MKTWRLEVEHMETDGIPHLIEDFFVMVLDFSNLVSIMIISEW